MTYAMDLASGVSPERLKRIRSEEGRAILGRGINFPFDEPAFAEAWGIRPLPDDFRSPVRSSVPAMFFSGTLDGRVSIPDAEDVRRGFPNSGHIIIDGSSHSPYSISPELRAEIVKFAAGGPPVSKHLSVPVQIR
jgi:pimeloyl-ACP methyl ester carboxylesterase